MSLKFYTEKIPGIKIFYPKKYKTQHLNTVYSIRQTLRHKIRDRSLDPKKKTDGVNFQPKF